MAILLFSDDGNIPAGARAAFDEIFSKVWPGVLNRFMFAVHSMTWHAKVLMMRLVRKAFSVLKNRMRLHASGLTCLRTGALRGCRSLRESRKPEVCTVQEDRLTCRLSRG